MARSYSSAGFDGAQFVLEATLDDGTVVRSRQASSPAANDANYSALVAKAQTALTTNATYLALSPPTAQQVTAQVRALTMETTAVIRLLIGALSDTSGT